ncbi:hypothetical protein DEIPH_ctg051orf0040 [Deinococcus phoenicis]|uniref:Uncharacterized protein n=1 Tax=Deinococcus phoenicis TaxID=1476583 RepID=A0A016QM50_9DEIO|nr:hypothetical protein [Deinococcus phoenicis]EYB67128.1 hypothetical protein DEIPH_ctg051orf0040 [Deinococcus phoenicis]
MTAPAPAAPRPALFPPFLLGWGLGTLLFLLVRTAGLALLNDPCRGRAVLALLVPLVLGPGGLAFTASNWGRPRRAALGLGLVVASFLPALAVGARDIGVLRATGCAGGYIILAPAGGSSVSEVNVRAGDTLDLTLRVGGYTPQSHPGPFALSTASSAPGITLTLPRREAAAGEVVPLRVNVAANTPPNTYTVGVQGVQRRDTRSFEAVGTLSVNVQP